MERIPVLHGTFPKLVFLITTFLIVCFLFSLFFFLFFFGACLFLIVFTVFVGPLFPFSGYSLCQLLRVMTLSFGSKPANWLFRFRN